MEIDGKAELTEKTYILTEAEEKFLLSYRKNYNRIKNTAGFVNHGIKYYQIMKMAQLDCDVYVDNVILRQEALEFNKKEKFYKNMITEIYAAIKICLNSFYEQTKNEYRKQVKSIMDAYNVTASTILKVTPEDTKSGIKKNLSLFEQELKLIFKNEQVNKRFEEFRKSISTAINNAAKRPSEIIDKTSQDSKSLSPIEKEENLTNQSLNNVKEVFKKPIYTPLRGKCSRINNSNPNDMSGGDGVTLNISDYNLSQRVEQEKKKSNQSSDTINEESFKKNIVNQSTKIRVIKSEIEVSPGNLEIKSSGNKKNSQNSPGKMNIENKITSTTKDNKGNNSLATFDYTTDEESFKKNIVNQSTKIAVIKSETKGTLESLQLKLTEDKRTTPGRMDKENIINSRIITSKDNQGNNSSATFDYTTDEESFKKHIVNQSTKIATIKSEIKVAPENLQLKSNENKKISQNSSGKLDVENKITSTTKDNKGSNSLATFDYTTDEESFKKHIVNQSTKIAVNKSEIKVTPNKLTDDKKTTPGKIDKENKINSDNKGDYCSATFDYTSDEESFRKYIVNQSTKIPLIKSEKKIVTKDQNENEEDILKGKKTMNSENKKISQNLEISKGVSFLSSENSQNDMERNKSSNSSLEAKSKVEERHLLKADGTVVIPSIHSFNVNIVNESTKLPKSNVEKKSEKEKRPYNVPNETMILPSDNTFNVNIVNESTKIPKASFEKKTLVKERNRYSIDDPDRNTFMNNVLIQSTKIPKNLADKKIKIPEKEDEPLVSKKISIVSMSTLQHSQKETIVIENGEEFKKSDSKTKEKFVSKELIEKTITPGDFQKNMPLAQSTVKPKSLLLSRIEETSEHSKSSNSTGSKGVVRISKAKNDSKETNKKLSINKSIPEEMLGILTEQNDCPKKLLAEMRKSINNESNKSEEKENKSGSIQKINLSDVIIDAKNSIQFVNHLDKNIKELKTGIKNSTLKRTEIDISPENPILNTYSCISPDPWNELKRTSIWSEVLPKLLSLKSVVKTNENFYLKKLSFGTNIEKNEFIIERKLKNGEFSEIYIGKSKEMSKEYIIKVLLSTVCLEYYFIKCIHRSEMKNEWKINIRPSICGVLGLRLTSKNSYLLMPYYNKGNLVDLCGYLQDGTFSIEEIELLTSYIALELISTIYRLHTHCKILHCNIRPETILLNEVFPVFKNHNKFEFSKTGVIVLLDFNRAINLNKFQRNSGFVTDDKSLSLRCIETKLERPWTYQIDLFNVATSLYMLLQKSYPRVIRLEGGNVFSSFDNSNLLRAGNVWLDLFHFLLNFESQLYDDILIFLDSFQQFISANIEDYNKGADKINNIIHMSQ